jgi:hypothetical protein
MKTVRTFAILVAAWLAAVESPEAFAARAESDPLTFGGARGVAFELAPGPRGAVLTARAGGKELFRRELDGGLPVTLLAVDLAGDGSPEALATVEEPGSGGYRRHCLLDETGTALLWDSGTIPGGAATVDRTGRLVTLVRLLKGLRPVGDYPVVERLTLKDGKPVLTAQPGPKPENGWQYLTAGLAALDREAVAEGVSLLTKAVDSPEGSGKELGPESRLALARALLANGEPAKSRAILVGLQKRFPGSLLAAEAGRTLALFDETYRNKHLQLIALAKAELAARGARWAQSLEASRDALKGPSVAGLTDRAHFLLGQANEALGQKREAVHEYQIVVLYFPESPMRQASQQAITRLETGGR